MPGEYIPILVFAVVVAAVPAAAFAWARHAGVPAPPAGANSAASEPLAFEETERRHNSSQIFLVGALFVFCDALLTFLALWAVRMNELGAFGLVAITVFLGVLAFGYVWVYKHRALERI